MCYDYVDGTILREMTYVAFGLGGISRVDFHLDILFSARSQAWPSNIARLRELRRPAISHVNVSQTGVSGQYRKTTCVHRRLGGGFRATSQVYVRSASSVLAFFLVLGLASGVWAISHVYVSADYVRSWAGFGKGLYRMSTCAPGDGCEVEQYRTST